MATEEEKEHQRVQALLEEYLDAVFGPSAQVNVLDNIRETLERRYPHVDCVVEVDAKDPSVVNVMLTPRINFVTLTLVI